MAKTTNTRHLDTTGTMCKYDPTITPRSTLNSQPKIENNNAKHTNLLDYDEKSLYLKWLSLKSQKVKL